MIIDGNEHRILLNGHTYHCALDVTMDLVGGKFVDQPRRHAAAGHLGRRYPQGPRAATVRRGPWLVGFGIEVLQTFNFMGKAASSTTAVRVPRA